MTVFEFGLLISLFLCFSSVEIFFISWTFIKFILIKRYEYKSIYIKDEIKIGYLGIEKYIVDLREEEVKDFYEVLENYQKGLKNCQKNAEIEISKNVIFSNLNNGLEDKNQKDIYEFYYLLMEDYYLIFLTENVPDIKKLYSNLDNYKNIIKLMLHQRFNTGDENEEIDPIKSIARKMVWMEAYSQYNKIIK